MIASTLTSTGTQIDYDPRKGRFIINAPTWLFAPCRGIPNRRWDARNKVWTAPAIRANADYLSRSTEVMQASFSRLARERIDTILAQHRERHQIGNFPTTYPFKTKPFAHQRAGLDALYGKRTMAWFMDMGTGKTKIVIDMHAALQVDHRCNTVLLLCPLSIRNNWVRQLTMHMPDFVRHDVHLLNNGPAGVKAYQQWLEESHDLRPNGQRWLIIGIESLAVSKTALPLAEAFVCSSTKTACIVDEAHKIKNDSALRTRAAYRLGRKSEWRTIMTGTPIANGPLDLFAMFQFLDPDIIGLGDFYSFRARYAIMGGYENREVLGYQNIDELTEIIAPFTFQARKQDVLDLPPKLYEVREVQLSPEQARLYATMRKGRIVATGNKSLVVQNVLEKMLRLQEIVGGFVSYENEEGYDAVGKPLKRTYREPIDGVNPKINELLNIAQETDQQTIIWCAFIDEIKAVVAALKTHQHTVAVIHGEYSEDERTAAIDLFQAKKVRFLVSNAAVGGLGLDMTAGTVEVYFSNTFSYTDRTQSEDRAHRIGQTQKVTIIDIVAKDTVDESIFAALQAKQNVSEYVRQRIEQHQLDDVIGPLAPT